MFTFIYSRRYFMGNTYERDVLIIYNCTSGEYHYASSSSEQIGQEFDECPLWELICDKEFVPEHIGKQFQDKINELSVADEPKVYFEDYCIKNTKEQSKWYKIGFVCPVPHKEIYLTFTDIDYERITKDQPERMGEYDKITGLFNRNGFDPAVEAIIRADKTGIAAGEYAMLCFDILKFKAINDTFGIKEGNVLLKYIANVMCKLVKEDDVICRPDSDHFIIFTHTSGKALEELLDQLLDLFAQYDLPFKVMCNVGIYVTGDENLSVDLMIDRAVLAQSVIKGSYTKRYNYYTEDLRKDMLSEQEIIGMMDTALAKKQFIVYYQPQYDHSTGMLVGAEALVRWKHPEKGLVSPGIFIPIFEKNGFITKIDLYVFEQTCCFLHKCIEKGLALVPISTNFSRHDIFQQDFVEVLEKIRTKYDIPARYLRVEITESSIVGSSQYANDVVKKLHQYGYIVEMDDFGSGYSSLNVLKDIELDIIKLDMLFLSEKSESNRGGTILSSVVRMAKWLAMPVIAEGVEFVEQADFLRSIGCDYIQGYLYSKPLPEEQYEELLSGSIIGTKVPQRNWIETLNACDFWNPSSQETLIFSNYVGGAAIFDYHNGKAEILRVNKKYLQEIGMNLSEKDLIETDPANFFDETNRKIYKEMLERAIETMDEQECETWRTLSSSCCGEDKMCIRCNVRLIGKSGDRYLFYAMIRNITTEKEHYNAILDSERRFKMASEQVNIYYWEYTIATKEMRPCFRCMRDLGLPALLTNYPDSAIEMGIFPPEVADMYRDWHVQIANGVPKLEAVIPLTVGRVPFHVRYTTEFDENGHPVKAYGSAALVV